MKYVNTHMTISIVFSLLLILLLPMYVQAQTIHDYPGKTAYLNSTEWPFIDGQTHCGPCDGTPLINPPFTLTPDLAHMHTGLKVPIWAEIGGVGSESIDIPVSLKLFHVNGGTYGLGGVLHGATGDIEVPVSADMFPLVGDPNNLVVTTGHITIRPQDGVAVGVPVHGWFSFRVNTRTYFPNGRSVDNEIDIPLYSMIDPAAPEVNIAGYTQSKGVMVNLADSDPTPFQLNEMEIRTKWPILLPWNNPQVVEMFGFDYTPAPFPPGEMQCLLDPDFHMGIPGISIPCATDSTAGTFMTLNPAAMSLSPTPMGLLSHQHRITLSWNMDSKDGFDDPVGHVSANQKVRNLLSFIVTVGNNPDDTLAPTFWTVTGLGIGQVPIVIPPVVVPPIIPPPPEWQIWNPTFRKNPTTGQHQWCDVDICFDLT